MEKPPVTELKIAFGVADKAEAYVLALMNAAKIPGASVFIHDDDPQPSVNLRASRRVFLNVDGKRNLESTRAFYGNVEKIIAEVGDWLKAKAA